MTSDRRRRRWIAAATAATALVASACSSSAHSATRATTTTAPRPTVTTAPFSGPTVIIDTDFSRWWDDATAVGIANVLHARGTVRVLGIVSDVPNPVAVAAIDAIDTAYGNGDIPLGAVAHSDTDRAKHGYSDVVAARLHHSVRSSDDVPDAVSLYRRLLTRAGDHSVTIVALGAYTNLAGLLRTHDGRTLVTKKVQRLVIMDGIFPGGGPAFTNQKLDLAAARSVVHGGADAPPWPTPIAWVDGFDGISTKVGAGLCTSVSADHPMRIVYESLFACGPPRDGDWDAPALLYAIGDVRSVFSELGRGGAAVVNPQGGLTWQHVPGRRHDVYVHVTDQARLNARIDELLRQPT